MTIEHPKVDKLLKLFLPLISLNIPGPCGQFLKCLPVMLWHRVATGSPGVYPGTNLVITKLLALVDIRNRLPRIG